jgi:hypothetical protein
MKHHLLFSGLIFCNCILAQNKDTINVKPCKHYHLVDNRTGIDSTLLEPTPEDEDFINKRRTSSYFRETFIENAPLSTTSFPDCNQRFYSDSFYEKKPCLLDAVTNFYIPVIGNWGFIQNGRKKNIFLIGFYFVPAFDVRIFQTDYDKGDASAPVRTPSLKAGGELLLSHSYFWNYRKTNIHKWRFALLIKGFHHSNGQDGPSISQVDTKSNKRGYINTYNGNFSEDFPLHFGIIAFHDRRKNSFFFRLGYEFSQYGPSRIDHLTRKYHLYATERIMLSGNLKLRPPYDFSIIRRKNHTQMKSNTSRRIMTNYNVEWLRVEYLFTYFVTPPKNWYYGNVFAKPGDSDALTQIDYFSKRRINVALTAHYRIPGTRGAGVFLQGGYFGQDTYNIYFQRPNWFLRFGLSYGIFAYPKKTDDLMPSY